MFSTEKLTHLGLYFATNLCLSILNKLVLGKFNFPLLITAFHASFTSVGCYILLWMGYFEVTQLTMRDKMVLVLFSTLFTINIAISNVSLSMVSMPFHQLMRSTGPAFTVLIYRFTYGQSYPMAIYMSLIPMVVGISMATYGDYYFTVPGFALTSLGVILASVKTIASNRLMKGALNLSPLEILLRMCPLAAVQSFIYAGLVGELQQLHSDCQVLGMPPNSTIIALIINGILAFAQNISSFQTNKIAGALTLTVCANLKQCLTIMMGIVLFHVKGRLYNNIGVILTLSGVFCYSWVEFKDKEKRVLIPK